LPDSTLFYGYGLVLRGVFQARQLMGYEGAHSVTLANENHETWIVETIRLINILVVVATLILLYAVTKRLASRQAATVAALLLTFSWMTIEHVWPIRPDLLTALIAVGIVWSCLEIIGQPTRRRYLIAATILGLGVATKYPMILLVFPLLLAHVQAWRRREIRWSDRRVWTDRHLWLAAAGSVLVVLAVPGGSHSGYPP